MDSPISFHMGLLSRMWDHDPDETDEFYDTEAGRAGLYWSEEDPLNDTVEEIFAIITEYAQPGRDPGGTRDAASETAAVLHHYFARPKREQGRLESKLFVLGFWNIFFAIARQVPHNHRSQDRLIQLVARMRGISTKDNRKDVWTDSEGLEESFRHSLGAPTNLTPYSIINLHSFGARLFGAGIVSWYHVALRLLSQFLEWNVKPPDYYPEPVKAIAAGQWIEHSGENLLKAMKDTVNPAFAHRPRNHIPSSWKIWKDIFQRLGSPEYWDRVPQPCHNSDLSIRKEAVDVATRCSKIMEDLEQQGKIGSESPPTNEGPEIVLRG